MSLPESFTHLVGRWQATNRVWTHPGAEALVSAINASVTSLAQGRFLSIAYTWSEGGPQDGLLLVGQEGQAGPVTAAWVDSWHSGDRVMAFLGELTAEGAFSVLGSYPAPEGPDWGWRIQVEPQAHTWRLAMFNITPDGQAMLAVEAAFERVK